MPYESNDQLPDSVKSVLPEHAQSIYRKALASALEEYVDPAKRRGSESLEEVAHRVAWGAVEQSYQKGPDGQWQAKARSS